MRLVANSVNGIYLASLLKGIDRKQLAAIDAAVAYATNMDELAALAKQTNVPFVLYTLIDADFPSASIVQKFLDADVHWQLLVTRDYFHAKVLWFRGVGAYVGSANLTQQAWWQNIECGVWLDEDELEEQGLDDQLQDFFSELGSSGRFVAATREHLDAVRSLARISKPVEDAKKNLQNATAQLLAGVPGATPPARVGTHEADAAMRGFISEWESTLTILRKLSAKVEAATWPAWVDKNVPPSIVQDQATEYWWHTHIRRNGEEPAETMMMQYHECNRAAPAAAVEQLFAEWSDFDASKDWNWFLNKAPVETRALLQREAIPNLNEDQLTTIIFNTHAAREHARQALKSDLGDIEEKSSQEERCRLLARFWLQQRPAPNRGVREMLDFVIWGDAVDSRIAARLWKAAHDPAWHIRRLGLSILGELVGYARPTEYPPRNHRVSKTLVALGFTGITV
ncbi:MAG TPA: phospholipase D-like domain-containing protein [Kofleriaceae bacterium]|jgi:hypothetical protein|nr:phospholipase D-like domain-containing protein [Kofleriaceae bacterium]